MEKHVAESSNETIDRYRVANSSWQRTLRGISLRRDDNCNKFPDSLFQRTGGRTDVSQQVKYQATPNARFRLKTIQFASQGNKTIRRVTARISV